VPRQCCDSSRRHPIIAAGDRTAISGLAKPSNEDRHILLAARPIYRGVSVGHHIGASFWRDVTSVSRFRHASRSNYFFMVANKAMLGPAPMSNLNNRNNRNALGLVLAAGALEYDEFIELGMILCAMITARPFVSTLFLISVGGLLILWPILKNTSPWTGRSTRCRVK
jgi:hypothetical protein